MWRPIVVGVENTEEAARAATLAETIARHAQTVCYPVHATRDIWAGVRTAARHAVVPERSAMADLSALPQTLISTATTEIRRLLGDRIRHGTLERLRVELGSPADVLGRAAKEVNAEMIVVGSKHHSSLGQWLGACAAERLLREIPVPILVGSPQIRGFHRVLVAVDFSEAAPPTIAWAERLVAFFDSAMRVVHVVEMLPRNAEAVAGMSQARFRDLSEEIMEDSIKPYVKVADAECVTREGHIVEALTREVEEWRADLLVLGTHGKGRAESFVLGSVAEHLLQKRPTSLLIVPGSTTA